MLKRRLITGILLAVGIVLLIWLDLFLGRADVLGRPALIMAPLTLAIAILATVEMVRWWDGQPWQPSMRVSVIGTTLIVGAAFVPAVWRGQWTDTVWSTMAWPVIGLAAAVSVIVIREVVRYRGAGAVLMRTAMTCWVAVYVGLLLSLLAAIRFHGGNAWGMVALLALLAPVKLADTMAYLLGRVFGRRKLAPQISPGKTIEGLIAGYAGGLIATFVVIYLVAPWITGETVVAPWWLAVGYGLMVTSAGVIGDLVESMLKRDSGQKDSGRSIPGIGGVLDLIDSVLGAAPVALIFWAIGALGPPPAAL